MLLKQIICASRGRNPEHPEDRRPGIYLEQRLELNSNDISNVITSVQKDNWVLEIYEKHDTNMEYNLKKE